MFFKLILPSPSSFSVNFGLASLEVFCPGDPPSAHQRFDLINDGIVSNQYALIQHVSAGAHPTHARMWLVVERAVSKTRRFSDRAPLQLAFLGGIRVFLVAPTSPPTPGLALQ